MAIAEQTLQDILGDEVVAVNVSLEEYMQRYSGEHCEWIEGVVIRMSPGELKHNDLLYFLHYLLKTYFTFRPLGRVIGQPFVVRLPEFPKRRREPDLLVVLNNSPHELKDTYLDGPPDICIEVVSEESGARDHGEKFVEYEKGGVGEYWIVDYLRQEYRFYRLNDEKRFVVQVLDEYGYYRTPMLPGFALHIPTLWQDDLPDPVATVEFVREQLES